jgi:hypothetical protein
MKGLQVREDLAGAFRFFGFFFSFIALIALLGWGAWWFLSHVSRSPLLDRHATSQIIFTNRGNT